DKIINECTAIADLLKKEVESLSENKEEVKQIINEKITEVTELTKDQIKNEVKDKIINECTAIADLLKKEVESLSENKEEVKQIINEKITEVTELIKTLNPLNFFKKFF
ncbi:MAG: hypothetical protein Q8888_01220, partial [Vigna little leaf phytoplasma]|nr:hypothetical protein [Vigna little leaf phytoplasma]